MIQLDSLKKRPERHTRKQTNRQKLTCRSSANFVSAGQKLKTAEKWRPTFTATAHATFPLDYHSINDLRLVMMFIVETGNRNPHVKKHDLQQSAKIKEDIWDAKTPNVKLYIRYWLDFEVWFWILRCICKMYDKGMHNCLRLFFRIYWNLQGV